ncbi:hypothetical protein D3C73_745600 [compost metagenome]
MQNQFAEGAEDQESEETTDCVGDNEGGTSCVESAAGAQEQARADCAADRDHLDLARLEVLVIAGVLLVEGFLAGVRLGRDRVVRNGVGHWNP